MKGIEKRASLYKEQMQHHIKESSFKINSNKHESSFYVGNKHYNREIRKDNVHINNNSNELCNSIDNKYTLCFPRKNSNSISKKNT